jgi:NADH-quinone oxidoreductase subunit N
MGLVATGAPSATKSEFAVGATLFYLLAYALTNLGTWAIVMAVERAEGEGLSLDDYAGLGSRRPALALAMALFMLSLTGLPPTIGFIGKFYVFRAALDAGYIWLAVVGVLTSLISAYYYLRIVIIMYMRAGEGQANSSIALNFTVGLTALATFIFGIIPGPVLAWATQVLMR